MAYRALPILLSIFYAPFAHAGEPCNSDYEQEMHKARQALKHHHGGSRNLSTIIERLEYQSNDGEPLLSWFAKGWYGDDIDKIGFKTEGEYDFDASEFEEFEFQFLYKHTITTFWDLQFGLRHDIKPQRTFLTFGIEGLAPYWFDIDTAGFINNHGLLLRLEVEQNFNITTTTTLQPRIELNFATEDDTAANRGSGLNNTDIGIRIHYKARPSFTPYIGIEWTKIFSNTAKLHRLEGEKTENLSFLIGIHTFF